VESLRMFVNGQAMSGGSINFALERARLIGPAETAPKYRFHSFRDEFPGLRVCALGERGFSVPGEIYEVTYEILRESLLPNEPPELELTVIELSDGSGSMSMCMRAGTADDIGVLDISDRGGWRAYLRATGGER
jgi:hypothetical protein